METREWLNRGRYLRENIKSLERAKTDAYILAQKTASDLSPVKVQRSTENSTEERFIEYAQRAAELDAQIRKLQRVNREIEKAISKVKNAKYRTLLIDRYINCLSWEKIGENVGVSGKWARKRMHRDALKAIEEVLHLS